MPCRQDLNIPGLTAEANACMGGPLLDAGLSMYPCRQHNSLEASAIQMAFSSLLAGRQALE